MKSFKAILFSACMFCVLTSTAQPVADFNFTVFCEEVQFTDQSTGNIVGWTWDFGDGGGSFVQNPTYTYSNSGTHTATLILIDDVGARDTVSKSFTITPGPSANISPGSAEICFGESIPLVATASGGNSPYDYDWNTGSSNTTLTVSPSSNVSYTVTVTDDDGCTATATRLVIVNAAPTASITPATVSICQGDNAVLSVSASGGSGSYTFAWNTGVVTGSNTVAPTITTTYTVTVTDAMHLCTTTATRTVVVNSAPNAVISGASGVCSGETAILTASGGVNYVWSTVATTSSITVSPSSTTTYTVTVTNANGCTDTDVHTVTIQPNPSASISPASPTICLGNIVTLVASGAGAGGGYDWSTGSSSASITVSPTSTTTYTVTVTSSQGCEGVASRTVTVSPSTVTVAITSSTNATCTGVCDGTAMAAAAGGSPPYTYDWQGTGITGTFAPNLCAGNYTVRALDASGCGSTDTVTISNISTFTLSIATTDVACFGECNGGAIATVTGGLTPVAYSFVGGSMNGNVITNLCAGQFSLTVQEPGGCNTIENFVISQPPALTTTITGGSVFCVGDCNGTGSISATGGVPPYSYLWNTGDSAPSLTGLCAGGYTVTTTDNNGCTQTDADTVTTQIQLAITILKQDATCDSLNSGQAHAIVTGGSGDYSYLWSNQETASTANGLSAGTYTVTVTDILYLCTATASVTILQEGMIPSVATSSSTCGNADGSATITVTAGIAPYTFAWNTSPPQTTSTATGLVAGTYHVTITDSTGCIRVEQVNVSDAGAPIISETTTPATCSLSSNGAIDLFVTGTPPFTFVWSNGSNTEDIANLGSGSYFVTVTDANGCIASHTATVNQQVLTLASSTTQATCLAADGTATVQVTGGTPPYIYQWSNGQTTSTATNLAPAWYSVTATDSSGCYRHTNVHVTEPPNCVVTVQGTVYLDLNNNCTQGVSEPGIPNVWIDYEPGGLVQTAANGSYSFNAPAGAITVTPVANPFIGINCPVSGSYSLTVSPGGTLSSGNNFGSRVTEGLDIKVSAITCGTARPGFQQSISFTIRNVASQSVLNGYADFVIDSRLTYSQLPSGGTVHGDTLRIQFTNLTVNSTRTYSFKAAIPSTMALGTMLTSVAMVYPVDGDIIPSNNTLSCSTMVTGSYDPNDKAVIPAGESPDGNITVNDSVLQYIIRFQNTGTDTAFTVVIKDTLDSNLDYLSFEQGTASHPYTVHFEEDDIVAFTFENIMLPDSNVNEPESHGHVTFFIEHNGVLPLGTTISNRAAIYFDYNLPVITNTVTNKIYDPTGIGEVYSLADNIKLYPNPAQDAITVEGVNGEQFTGIFITDMLGKRVYESVRMKTSKHSVRVGDFSAGVYFISVLTEKGVSTKKLMVE